MTRVGSSFCELFSAVVYEIPDYSVHRAHHDIAKNVDRMSSPVGGVVSTEGAAKPTPELDARRSFIVHPPLLMMAGDYIVASC